MSVTSNFFVNLRAEKVRTIDIQISDSLYKWVKKYAERMGISVNEFIILVVTEKMLLSENNESVLDERLKTLDEDMEKGIDWIEFRKNYLYANRDNTAFYNAFGGWDEAESAEELIRAIKGSRTLKSGKKPINFQ